MVYFTLKKKFYEDIFIIFRKLQDIYKQLLFIFFLTDF